MTEQSVRDRIAEAMFRVDGEELYGDSDSWDEAVRESFAAVGYYRGMADAAIDIIREAMLAPSTIAASHKGVPPPCQIERVLTNALNEVFGTE